MLNGNKRIQESVLYTAQRDSGDTYQRGCEYSSSEKGKITEKHMLLMYRRAAEHHDANKLSGVNIMHV